MYLAKNHPIKHKFIDKIPKGVLQEINNYKNNIQKVPLVINGIEITQNPKKYQTSPYNKNQIIAEYNVFQKEDLTNAIETHQKAKQHWKLFPLEKKYEIFLKAADLIGGKYRNQVLASTILGQGKNIFQAEIDAVCESIDFLTFGVQFHQELMREQPISPGEDFNKSSWRSLNGFVTAISPFNFTAIGLNLAATPLLMGNSVIWKPSDYSILSNYLMYEILIEAGIPKEILNFVPGCPQTLMEIITKSKDLGGLVFTGSSEVFDGILKKVYENKYYQYPRVVGETGGNNYHFVFPDMRDKLEEVVEKTILGAYEYSGQKCSATGRIYLPKEFYDDFGKIFTEKMKKLKIGSPEEDDNFMSAVIHENSFNKIKHYLKDHNDKIIYGGNTDNSIGNFIEPTVILRDNFQEGQEEVFGPVLNLFLYENLEEALIHATHHQYQLTGAIFYQDETYQPLINTYIEGSVGNLYINDKSTGSIVGNQPFGGFGKSGTNDKAGSKYFLTRFGNSLTTKIGCL